MIRLQYPPPAGNQSQSLGAALLDAIFEAAVLAGCGAFGAWIVSMAIGHFPRGGV